MNLFDQFLTPSLLGISLLMPALLMTTILLLNPKNQWLSHPTTTIKSWFINQAAKQIMTPINPTGHKHSLILISLLILLSLTNLLGLLPYTFTPTTQLSMNMAIALPLWLVTVLIGLRTQPTTSLAHLLPEGTPMLLIPILILIETISLLIRPIALGVRLTANLTAGHLLIQLISIATLNLWFMMPPLSLLTSTVLILLLLLEFAVAMIQAYVFVLLLSLYLQENS
ncbi:ATP synthase F0 subunit 6 (mitochondrion) [Alligator mississippiensis]|uniref:ATP synthase F(0) complex subunit a n=1 Tax=Alligator mississippiensis TaxID=8496 RepID=ATP6_ALLMI|nr:ATP synthase F0 subunit 6 [Alligator mississippiensis]O47872.1 RecName: Full=ATP synthase subunit a; AltName: Full=F-ATPase protein 6 [Alligator mississippiensis]AAD09985.1 ATPase 6 [Alligator mississippiensis]CAA73566.1 ATP synthase subunit 6 [Alligator mississippiensis]